MVSRFFSFEMYGLIFENAVAFIKSKYGEEAWENIYRLANVEKPSFSIHQVYPDQLLSRLIKKATTILGINEAEFFENMGYYFVDFVGCYGYGDVLSLLGRQLRDFLNGLDNLHEYLKYSYPRLRAPSYFCDNETEQGLVLHYRSKRRGFTHYTMGQLRSVAEKLYKLDLEISLLEQEVEFDTVRVSFQLVFDNRTSEKRMTALIREEARLPAVSSSLLFEIFPFLMIFGEDMIIQTIGIGLTQIMPDLPGKKLGDVFDVVRPIIEFRYQTILSSLNNIFELQTIESLRDDDDDDDDDADGDYQEENVSEKSLHLKGQMMFMPDWNVILFLGCPYMTDIADLRSAKLFINDLPIHDFSRDILLASSHRKDTLKEALETEMERTIMMEENMKKLDVEMRRNEELLCQMIPKFIAEQIQDGVDPINTCQAFDSVTIIFSDIPSFGDICAQCDGMEIVTMLNNLFGLFDHLSDRNSVYKVETVKDSFVGVSGAPEKYERHAERIMDMALDMKDCVIGVKDPRPGSRESIKIRLGSHSGSVVAGIVGNKCPRYCLFGDAMNTSSRMMSFGEEQRIHISSDLKQKLPSNYKTVERGVITVKGKGEMTTHWLESKTDRIALSESEIASILETIKKE